MQGYRDAAPSPPDSVVIYYPNGRTGRWLLFAMFFAMFFGGNVGALASLVSVSMHCDRDSFTCSIDTDYPVIGVRSNVIPLSEIKDARVSKSSAKHGTAYRIVLVTTSGDIDAGSGSYDRARITAVDQVNAFLLSKTAPSIDVICDASNGNNAILMSVMSVLVLFLGWLLNQYARVEINWSERVLSIVRVRWPIHSRVLTFPLDTVRDAIVTSGRGSKGGHVYGVSLVTGEGEIPLLDEKSSSSSAKEKTAAEIRALLEQAGGRRNVT